MYADGGQELCRELFNCDRRPSHPFKKSFVCFDQFHSDRIDRHRAMSSMRAARGADHGVKQMYQLSIKTDERAPTWRES